MAAALRRSFSRMAAVMSSAYTVPVGPVNAAAIKASVPDPLPMSSTTSPSPMTCAANG
jgi:hypothetical protein